MSMYLQNPMNESVLKLPFYEEYNLLDDKHIGELDTKISDCINKFINKKEATIDHVLW